MLTFLLHGFALGLPAAASPGPFQAFLIDQSLRNGWRRTLPSVMAPLISDGPIIILVLLLLNQTPDAFLRVVKIVGGLFILYLAKGAFDNFRHPGADGNKFEGSNHNSLIKASLTNLLSPNPYIFWSIAAGPILLAGWRSSTYHGVGFLLGFYGAFMITTSLLVILFANSRRFGRRFTWSLRGLAAIALLIFGLIQLWSGLLG